MIFPSCPFCNKDINYTLNSELFCSKPDHEFWQGNDTTWQIYHAPTSLIVSETQLYYIDNYGKPLLIYPETKVEEGVKILLKAIKLHIFS